MTYSPTYSPTYSSRPALVLLTDDSSSERYAADRWADDPAYADDGYADGTYAGDAFYAAAEPAAPLPWDGGEETWRLAALCAETDPEAFFPEKGGSTREAKRVCVGCEVRAECLEFALANDERFGIWGGLSERERRRIRLERRDSALSA